MPYDPALIVTEKTRHIAIANLVENGHRAATLHILGNVALANLYHDPLAHDSGQEAPTEAQRIAASILCALVGNLPRDVAAPVDEDLVRRLVRQEIDKHATKRLEITGPRGTVTIDGPTHYRTELVIKIASIGHAILLVGPAGCGKTTIGEHVAKALQLPFYLTSTTNETHELLGFVDGHGKYHSTPFRDAYEHGGLWVADEIDAWDATTLLVSNSALANGWCGFPDRSEPLRRHDDFRMIATANTFGTGADRMYVGRNELDAASLDRFATVDVKYDLTLERMFAGGADEWLKRIWHVRKRVNELKLRHVVSSRAIAMGAAALAIGLDRDDVEDIYLFKGMSAKDREKI